MKRILIIAILSITMAGARSQAALSIFDSTATTELDTVTANQAVSYSIFVENVGNQNFSGDISIVVAVQDTLGTPIAFHIDSMAFANAIIPPGGFQMGTINHTISMAFYNNGNNITVIWPQTPNTNTLDTLYIPTYVLQSNGIGQLDQMSISLYPNPTNGPIRVDVAGEVIDELEVYTMTGAVVARGTDNGQIDLGSLPRGQYFLRLRTRSGKIATRPLMKQ